MRNRYWSSDWCSSDFKALDRAAVHELFERESVLARAGEQRDDLSALLPVMKSRAGDAAFMERARTGDRPGPFFERRLSRIVGEAAATFLKVDQFSRSEEHTSELQSLMRI